MDLLLFQEILEQLMEEGNSAELDEKLERINEELLRRIDNI